MYRKKFIGTPEIVNVFLSGPFVSTFDDRVDDIYCYIPSIRNEYGQVKNLYCGDHMICLTTTDKDNIDVQQYVKNLIPWVYYIELINV